MPCISVINISVVCLIIKKVFSKTKKAIYLGILAKSTLILMLAYGTHALKKKENNSIQEDQESVCFKTILENLSKK